MAKISKPVLYTIVVGAVAYAAVVLTEPEKVKSAKPVPRASSKATKKGDVYLKEDYDAKFEPVNLTAKNAFKPLVVRTSGGIAESVAPNAIPSLYAGGDPNWTFTGVSEMDGSVMGLVENAVSGEGGFLKRGDRWKTSVVEAVASDTLTLRSADGTVKVLKLEDGSSMATGEELAPVKPALSGAIGNVAVTPTGTVRQDSIEGRQRAN